MLMVEDLSHTLDLVRRAQSGERPALEHLMERYYDRVRALVRIRLGSRLRGLLESGDILQETLMTAMERFQRFEMRDEGSLIHWLGKLAEHKITDAAEFHAAAKRDVGRCRPLHKGTNDDHSTAFMIDLVDPDASPSEHAMFAEESDLLESCIGNLPEIYRELILLRNYAGCSWEAVARESQRPSPAAARMMHTKAMIALGRMMHERQNA